MIFDGRRSSNQQGAFVFAELARERTALEVDLSGLLAERAKARANLVEYLSRIVQQGAQSSQSPPDHLAAVRQQCEKIAELELENAELRQRLRSEKDEVDALARDFESRRHQLEEEFLRKDDELKHELDQARVRTDQLETDLNQAVTESESKSRELTRCCDDMKALQEQLAATRSMLDCKEQRLQAEQLLRKDGNELSLQLEDLQTQVSTKDRHCEELRKKVHSLESTASAECNELLRKKLTLQAEAAQLQQTQNSQLNALATVETRLEATRRELKKLSISVAEAQSLLVAEREKQEKTSHNLRQLQREHSEVVQALCEEKGALSRAREELGNAQSELMSVAKHLETKEAEIVRQRSVLAELHKQLQSAESSLVECKHSHQAEQHLLENLRSARESLAEDVERSRVELRQSTTDLVRQRAALTEANTSLAETRAASDRATADLTATEEEFERMKLKIDSERNASGSAFQGFTSGGSVASSVSKSSGGTHLSSRQLELSYRHLQKRIQSEKQVANQGLEETKSLVSEHKKHASQLQKDVASLEQRHQSLRGECRAAEEILEETKRRISKLTITARNGVNVAVQTTSFVQVARATQTDPSVSGALHRAVQRALCSDSLLVECGSLKHLLSADLSKCAPFSTFERSVGDLESSLRSLTECEHHLSSLSESTLAFSFAPNASTPASSSAPSPQLNQAPVAFSSLQDVISHHEERIHVLKNRLANSLCNSSAGGTSSTSVDGRCRTRADSDQLPARSQKPRRDTNTSYLSISDLGLSRLNDSALSTVHESSGSGSTLKAIPGDHHEAESLLPLSLNEVEHAQTEIRLRERLLHSLRKFREKLLTVAGNSFGNRPDSEDLPKSSRVRSPPATKASKAKRGHFSKQLELVRSQLLTQSPFARTIRGATSRIDHSEPAKRSMNASEEHALNSVRFDERFARFESEFRDRNTKFRDSVRRFCVQLMEADIKDASGQQQHSTVVVNQVAVACQTEIAWTRYSDCLEKLEDTLMREREQAARREAELRRIAHKHQRQVQQLESARHELLGQRARGRG